MVIGYPSPSGRYVVTANGLMLDRIWVSSISETNQAVSWTDDISTAHHFLDFQSALECKRSVTDYRSDTVAIQGVL